VRLKSFEAHGFKSFAEKVELSFEDGITAIVGPNGSGKSNISDAIRWVMGEQSAKYLRGSKMEDVIFSGSNTRRALGMAEVNLTFDNTDHALPLDFDQVDICRRVYRSGDSEYFINKKACRLKDIVTLLSDTGLGRGSMSVIGQNKIDEILNSRPEERRAIFEEAAGIAKYRMRKKEAMRKLDDTASNLVRINDIKSEIESRIEPLKEAAATTEKYLEFADKLRKVQVTQFVHRIENIEVVKNKLAVKFEELEAKSNEMSTNVSVKEADGMSLKLELDKLNEEYNQLQTVLAEKEKNIEILHGNEAVLGERIVQSQRAIERIGLSKEKLQEQLLMTEKNLKIIVRQYDELDKDRQMAQVSANKLSLEKNEIEEKISEFEDKLNGFKSSVFESMQKIVDLRNDIRGLEQTQAQLQRQREQLKNEILKTENRYAEVSQQHNSLLEEQANVGVNTKIIKEQVTKITTQKIAEDVKLQACFSRRGTINKDIEKLEARLSMLENMEKEHEGFSRGVKVLLNTKEPWRPKIVGVVAELFKVKDKYVVAIETALGGAMQNLVTIDAQTAKVAINYLKSHNGGRATFLPLDTIRPREFSEQYKNALGLPGILGVASDFVACSENVSKVAKFLLGQVLVAENMDSALAAAKLTDMRVRVVTLEGEVIYAGGSMSGGQKQTGATSFLSRKKEIETTVQTLEIRNKELLLAQEAIEAEEEIIKGLDTKLEEFRHTLQKDEIRQAELVAFIDRTTAEKSQHMENITLLTQERTTHTNEFLAAKERLAELVPQLSELEKTDAEGKEIADKLQRELAAAKNQQTVINARYQDAMITLEGTKARTGVIEERMKQIDIDVSRLQQEIAENEEEEIKAKELIETTKIKKANLAKEQQLLVQELKTTGDGKEEFLAKRVVLADKQALAQEELDEAKKQLYICQQKLHAVELEKVKQLTEYEGALEQMKNAHKLSPEEARAQDIILEMSDTALNKQAVGLQSDIESLGVVNMASIEEYKAVSERFDFLDKQYKDLCEAKEQLEDVIGGINSDMSKRFREAFAKINEYFGLCYTRLFGGGSAQIVMQDDQDFLESGVEIIVQPPGKKLQNLALLSGGERALTVIALLFALLSYQPAPFSILDEIDAPLDEANIDRFANFLKDYATRGTQFIVITHRKGTMEAADVLHGVTMEESGVSRLLSVKLAEME